MLIKSIFLVVFSSTPNRFEILEEIFAMDIIISK